MNWDQFKKNVGMRYQLEPVAQRIDVSGNALPEEDDDWFLENVSPLNIIRLQNLRTGHIAELGKDHIFDFRSNPSRSAGATKFGFLILKMQIILKGNEVLYRPNWRPGEPAVRQYAPKVQPSRAIITLLEDLSQKKFWGGTPSDYNKYAARVLYGNDFGDLITEPADYFSALLVHDLIEISSIVDNGNRSDGTADTTLFFGVAPNGREELSRAKAAFPSEQILKDKKSELSQ